MVFSIILPRLTLGLLHRFSLLLAVFSPVHMHLGKWLMHVWISSYSEVLNLSFRAKAQLRAMAFFSPNGHPVSVSSMMSLLGHWGQSIEQTCHHHGACPSNSKIDVFDSVHTSTC